MSYTPISGVDSNGELTKDNYAWINWFNLVAEKSVDIQIASLAVTPALVAPDTTAEQTFTLTGIKSADIILTVEKPSLDAGISIPNYRVSADDEIKLTYANNTAGGITPTAETYKIVYLKQQR